MKQFTDKQLNELIRIVSENQNINDRWVALSKDPINLELKLEKSEFLRKYGLQNKSIEGRIRDYLHLCEAVNLRDLRKDLDESNDANFFAPYASAKPAKSGAVGITILAFSTVVTLLAFALSNDQATEDVANETIPVVDVRTEVDICVESSRFEQSCRSDPEFTYCSIAFEEQLGSGCTTRIQAVGGITQQGEFCIAELTPIIRTQCAIEIFGCAAVTGNVNC